MVRERCVGGRIHVSLLEEQTQQQTFTNDASCCRQSNDDRIGRVRDGNRHKGRVVPSLCVA